MNSFIIVAGGTGGHIYGAQAIGDELQSRGFAIQYVASNKSIDLKLYQGFRVCHLPMTGWVGKSVLDRFQTIRNLFSSFFKSLQIIYKSRCVAIIGVGGHVALPVFLAGFMLRKKLFIVEQNAIFGLTNRILAPFSQIIFTHLAPPTNFSYTAKCIQSGNPLRSDFYKQDFSYPELSDEFRLNVLIFGGSLGAKEINDWVKSILLNQFPFPLTIVHQVGEGKGFDIGPLGPAIHYTQKTFLDPIWEYYRFAHLIIARAGASTLAEIKVVQRPTIFIPLKIHSDQHQWFNASALAKEVSFPVWVEKTPPAYSTFVHELEQAKKYTLDNRPKEIRFKGISPAIFIVDKILLSLNMSKCRYVAN